MYLSVATITGLKIDGLRIDATKNYGLLSCHQENGTTFLCADDT